MGSAAWFDRRVRRKASPEHGPEDDALEHHRRYDQHRAPPPVLEQQLVDDGREDEGAEPGSADGDPGGEGPPLLEVGGDADDGRQVDEAEAEADPDAHREVEGGDAARPAADHHAEAGEDGAGYGDGAATPPVHEGAGYRAWKSKVEELLFERSESTTNLWFAECNVSLDNENGSWLVTRSIFALFYFLNPKYVIYDVMEILSWNKDCEGFN